MIFKRPRPVAKSLVAGLHRSAMAPSIVQRSRSGLIVAIIMQHTGCVYFIDRQTLSTLTAEIPIAPGPAQLAHQNQQPGRQPMTKAKTKAKAIRMPGKERPAASRLVIQRPLPPEPHHRNHGKNTKPSTGQPIGQTAEGLDYRFLRSQPRVIGPGCPARRDPGGAITTLTRNRRA